MYKEGKNILKLYRTLQYFNPLLVKKMCNLISAFFLKYKLTYQKFRKKRTKMSRKSWIRIRLQKSLISKLVKLLSFLTKQIHWRIQKQRFYPCVTVEVLSEKSKLVSLRFILILSSHYTLCGNACLCSVMQPSKHIAVPKLI